MLGEGLEKFDTMVDNVSPKMSDMFFYNSMAVIDACDELDTHMLRFIQEYNKFVNLTNGYESFIPGMEGVVADAWESIKKFVARIYDFFVGLVKKVYNFVTGNKESLEEEVDKAEKNVEEIKGKPDAAKKKIIAKLVRKHVDTIKSSNNTSTENTVNKEVEQKAEKIMKTKMYRIMKFEEYEKFTETLIKLVRNVHEQFKHRSSSFKERNENLKLKDELDNFIKNYKQFSEAYNIGPNASPEDVCKSTVMDKFINFIKTNEKYVVNECGDKITELVNYGKDEIEKCKEWINREENNTAEKKMGDVPVYTQNEETGEIIQTRTMLQEAKASLVMMEKYNLWLIRIYSQYMKITKYILRVADLPIEI